MRPKANSMPKYLMLKQMWPKKSSQGLVMFVPHAPETFQEIGKLLNTFNGSQLIVSHGGKPQPIFRPGTSKHWRIVSTGGYQNYSPVGRPAIKIQKTPNINAVIWLFRQNWYPKMSETVAKKNYGPTRQIQLVVLMLRHIFTRVHTIGHKTHARGPLGPWLLYAIVQLLYTPQMNQNWINCQTMNS